MVLPLLLACRQDDDESPPTVAAPIDALADALGDCEGFFRDPGEYPNQLIPGDELSRATLTDPQAVCNDGTPAVLYVRPATSELLADTWSIHLQGGGGCASWTSCVIRWCGLEYHDAGKMSSAWAPETVGAVGIFDADPANVLATANQAYFYYCSSDVWTGQGTASYEAPEVPTTTTGFDTSLLPDELPSYAMPRQGHAIVVAGIEALLDGIQPDVGAPLPSLADATEVFFSGTSAGSDGAIVHADWLSELLAPNGTVVRAIFDAQLTPTGTHLPDHAQAIDDSVRTAFEEEIEATGRPPVSDASCEASVGAAEAWRCNDHTYVITEHVTTPFFARQDLRDVTDRAGRLAIPEDAFEVGVAAMLDDLGGDPGTPGVYGPNCAQHVALETNDWWRVATVEDAGGTALTFQDAVFAWYTDGAARAIDEPVPGEGAGPLSECVAVDPEH